jgi:threonine dehydratase
VFRLEILEDLPGVDSVFICTGGGGLISGIATYMKTMKPSVKVLNELKEMGKVHPTRGAGKSIIGGGGRYSYIHVHRL